MASYSLNKRQKAQSRLILNLLVVSLLMEQIRNELGDEAENPAVSQCTALIDEIFAQYDQRASDRMVHVINRARKKLTNDVRDMAPGDGLIGALRVLTSGRFKSKPGTRLDYILSTFGRNLKMIEDTMPFDETAASNFAKYLNRALNGI